jgi:ribosome biogenesis GTPase
METLLAYGWDARVAAALAALGDADLEAARVVEEQRGMCRIVTAGGERRAEVAGKLRRDGGSLPAVGDWVAVQLGPGGEAATIRAVLERRTKISRKMSGRTVREQVLAANLDTVFVVTSCNEDFSPRRIERYLTMTWESGASPVVLLNKTDLVSDANPLGAEAMAVAPGVPVHTVSATRAGGLDALHAYLQPGRTVALIGSSGVGKSTIVNRLMGEEVQDVREIREDDARGRHTTRSRQLFLLPGGALVLDTPGLRELALWITDTGLGQTFADIEQLAQGCRFPDCVHESEPDCAVKGAVDAGTLDADRLEGYRKLRRELEHLEQSADPLARAEKRRYWKEVHRNLRAGRKKGWFRD